jgi:hypothetical protein
VSTIDIDAQQLAGLGLTAKEEVLVLHSAQGPFDRYSLVMPPGVLIASTPRPDPDHPFPGNRKVEKARAQKFADYLSANAFTEHGWTCPPHQLRAHPSDVVLKRWINEPAHLAVVELEKFRSWDIQDGQHRILGFNLFNDQTQQRITELRRLVSAAERSGDRELLATHKKNLAGVEALRRRILEESTVEVVIVVANDEAHGQMFADIAMHAKGINPDFATYLDQRDPVHRIATELMEGYSPLSGLVNDGQEGRTSSSSTYLLGAKSLADLCHGVIVGPGRVGKRVRDEIERAEKAWTERIKDFLNAIFETLPDLKRLKSMQIDAPTLRSESLLGSATMLRVLAIAWHELVHDEDGPKMSVSEMKAFFAELEPHFRCFEDVKVKNGQGDTVIKNGVPSTHTLWGPTGMFQAGNRAPSARQGDVNQFGKIVASWAQNGLPG